MHDWKNYRWLVITFYVLFPFIGLVWLVLRDFASTILFIFFAVLTLTAHKQYKKAIQQSDTKEKTPQVKQTAINNLVNKVENNASLSSRQTQIEKRINQLAAENPNLTEAHIQELILKEEKEKIVQRVLSGVKIEMVGSGTPNQKKNNTRAQSMDVDLSYSKVRKLVPNFVVLDFETTGLSHFENEIIQIAAVRYVNFKEADKYVTLLKPSKPIPARITKINGISNDDVKDSPTIKEALPVLLEFIKNDVIIAHNASFDMKFLLANIHKQKIDYKKFKVIDTLPLARKHINSTENHKLPTLKVFLKLNHYKSHEALHDCYVTGELYKYCFEEQLVNKS